MGEPVAFQTRLTNNLVLTFALLALAALGAMALFVRQGISVPLRALKAVADGSFKGGNVYGEVGLAPFHDLDSKVPADLKTKLEDIRKKLLDGSLKTNVAPAKPA